MSSPGEYLGRNKVHEVCDDGRFVVLDNGSRWEIPNPEDRRETATWGKTEVYITANRFAGPGFILACADSEKAVEVRFAGAQD